MGGKSSKPEEKKVKETISEKSKTSTEQNKENIEHPEIKVKKEKDGEEKYTILAPTGSSKKAKDIKEIEVKKDSFDDADMTVVTCPDSPGKTGTPSTQIEEDMAHKTQESVGHSTEDQSSPSVVKDKAAVNKDKPPHSIIEDKTIITEEEKPLTKKVEEVPVSETLEKGPEYDRTHASETQDKIPECNISQSPESKTGDQDDSLKAVTTIETQGSSDTKSIENDQEEDIPEGVKVMWTKHGNEVAVTGSFSNWKEHIPLKKVNEAFIGYLKLDQGKHQFKFVVDGEWMYDHEQDKEDDGFGGFNNIIVIS